MSASPPSPPPDEGHRQLRALSILQSSSAWFAKRFAEFAAEAEGALARTKSADPQRERALRDALAQFRALRPELEHALLAALAERIGRLIRSPSPTRPRTPLRLVSDEDLAVALAIAPLARQARELAADHWRLLEQCLAQLFPPPGDDALWPLEPGDVLAAFREASRVLADFDRDALLILLDGFGACVLARLPELYEELLDALASELGGQGDHALGKAQQGDRSASVIWSHLEQLLRRAEPEEAKASAAAPTPELLHALSLLQTLPERAGLAPHRGAELKTAVLEKLAGLRGGQPPRLSVRDECGIDLVGMLFDFILRDEAIPEKIRLILARLQVPCIKAVLIEPQSLVRRDAAPRRLLDALAEAAVGWSEEADRDGRLLKEIEGAVETVRREFDEDLDVFDRAHKSFASFEASERQRAEAAAQRHLAAVRGRERLRLARAEVGEQIAELVGDQPLPATLRNLLFGPWAHYLVLTMLRQGEEGPAFREALALAKRLVALARGVHDRPSSEERTQLEASLRHGLHMVAVHDREVEAYIAWLAAFLGADPQPSTCDIPTSEAARPLAPPLHSEAGRERIRLAAKASQPTELDPPPIGSWWCFREEGRERRARLIWKSPLDGRLLFVHRRGGPSLELDALSFAAARAAGQAFLLPSGESLIERALHRLANEVTAKQGHAR